MGGWPGLSRFLRRPGIFLWRLPPGASSFFAKKGGRCEPASLTQLSDHQLLNLPSLTFTRDSLP
jgi:hypothetical protein